MGAVVWAIDSVNSQYLSSLLKFTFRCEWNTVSSVQCAHGSMAHGNRYVRVRRTFVHTNCESKSCYHFTSFTRIPHEGNRVCVCTFVFFLGFWRVVRWWAPDLVEKCGVCRKPLRFGGSKCHLSTARSPERQFVLHVVFYGRAQSRKKV